MLTSGSRWDEAPGEMLGILAMALALPGLILVMSCVNVSALQLSRSVLLLLSVLATLLAIAYPASRRNPLMALREE